MYPNVSLYIDGAWRAGGLGDMPITDPATEEELGRLANASPADLDDALAAAERAFRTWSKVSAFERSGLLRKVGVLLRERRDAIAEVMTREQGKPLAQSRLETDNSANMFDWFAEEARRAYGRVIPSRADAVHQLVVKEPVGPVAAFTPWNFPVNQSARKVAAALAAGCTIILKGPEDTPGSVAMMVQAIADAGVPAGVVNLVYGNPADVSNHLIPSPVIRKISFTGSTVVGKHLAALAGQHMKRVTMELGGHAPVIVFGDADIESASTLIATQKFRNAGQVCISPTRLLVQEDLYENFVDRFLARTATEKLGHGLESGTTMGPLAHHRRVEAMESLVADAVKQGSKVRAGGSRSGNKGHFFQPTVLTDVPLDARVMNEEPFGPVALISPFKSFDDAIKEANRLPFGLAAYAYTRSAETAAQVSGALESGMVSINHFGLGLPETPFGGVKDSGYGSEGGTEAIEAYLATKFVTHLAA